MEAEIKSLNRYALAFDLESVDKLASVLAAIKENPNKGFQVAKLYLCSM